MTVPTPQDRTHHRNPRRDLSAVLGGSGCAFAGLLLILGAEKLLTSSLQQELIALAGILLVAAGALLTLRGYLGLSLFRLLRFLHEQRH